MREIATVAGFGVGTIYRHFPTRAAWCTWSWPDYASSTEARRTVALARYADHSPVRGSS